MTYYDRQFQLNKTLLSIGLSAYKNFEVVIVDDNSPQTIVLPKLTYKVTVLNTENKCWTNPEPAYNMGINYAMSLRPSVIILQNAECFHVGDIISYATKVNDKNYFSFACYSINKESTFNGWLNGINNECAKHNGHEAWYNHPIYRPSGYDFCSAITSINMLRLNGYDERFSDGCGYGDDYLLDRIKKIGLKVNIITKPYVVHQWHYTQEDTSDKSALVEKNRTLFQTLSAISNYRAQHKYTEDIESSLNKSMGR